MQIISSLENKVRPLNSVTPFGSLVWSKVRIPRLKYKDLHEEDFLL